MTDSGWEFACPICCGALRADPEGLGCLKCSRTYAIRDGIWRFLPEERLRTYARFLEQYQIVREAEGRYGDAEYYRALPYRDLSRRMPEVWAIRARSLDALVDRVLVPLEERLGRGLKILDLGAGNGWLAHRLSLRGHLPAAIDLRVDDHDGLGVCMQYPVEFPAVQAEFDRLPFTAGQADLIIFNAAFHYSGDYETTLNEAVRVLRPDRPVVVMDTPFYPAAESGEAMVSERKAQFVRRYGFASDELESENYLTVARLTELERAGFVWTKFVPRYGLRWRLRPWTARLLGRRTPANFYIFVSWPRLESKPGSR